MFALSPTRHTILSCFSVHRPIEQALLLSSNSVNLPNIFPLLTFRAVFPRLFSTAPSFIPRSRMATKFNVVFVLGPPGSGKGTQCERIHNNLGYIHLSAGDLLREERQREGSDFGSLIEGHIRNGTIVPVEITCKLLENAMNAAGDAKGFLIDGFPRNKDNLNGWEREMGSKANVRFVLFLSCPVETCINRCLNRGQGRSDDNRESLEKRIRTYNNETLPIVEFYRSINLVKEISSEIEPDAVYEEVVKAFEASA